MRFCSRRAAQFLISTFKEHKYKKQRNDIKDIYSAAFHPLSLANHTSNTKRLYSEDRKTTLIDNLLKVVTNAETCYTAPEVSSSEPSRLSQGVWKASRRVQKLLPHLFTEDSQLLPTVSVEQQLKGLMQIWELEEAVKVLKTSMLNGSEPNSAIILDLLEQLANMGEIDCLLELYEFLKDRGLTTNLRFYNCLRDAYFNSGRIEEGVTMLRLLYHSTRDFKDVDTFFTLLTVMIIKHFVHRLPLIESFISDLEASDPPVLSARASLWRCFVLAEKFKAADDLFAKHDHLKKMVPEQVTRIVQSPLELDYNRSTVLEWLLHLPYLKAGLKASVFNLLVQHKSIPGHEDEWLETLDLLSTAMDQGMKVHQQTVQIFLTRFLSQLSPEQVQQISDWADKLEKLPDAEDS